MVPLEQPVVGSHGEGLVRVLAYDRIANDRSIRYTLGIRIFDDAEKVLDGNVLVTVRPHPTITTDTEDDVQNYGADHVTFPLIKSPICPIGGIRSWHTFQTRIMRVKIMFLCWMFRNGGQIDGTGSNVFDLGLALRELRLRFRYRIGVCGWCSVNLFFVFCKYLISLPKIITITILETLQIKTRIKSTVDGNLRTTKVETMTAMYA